MLLTFCRCTHFSPIHPRLLPRLRCLRNVDASVAKDELPLHVSYIWEGSFVVLLTESRTERLVGPISSNGAGDMV